MSNLRDYKTLMFPMNSTKSESKFSFHIFGKELGKLGLSFLYIPFHLESTGHLSSVLIESAIFLNDPSFL